MERSDLISIALGLSEELTANLPEEDPCLKPRVLGAVESEEELIESHHCVASIEAPHPSLSGGCLIALVFCPETSGDELVHTRLSIRSERAPNPRREVRISERSVAKRLDLIEEIDERNRTDRDAETFCRRRVIIADSEDDIIISSVKVLVNPRPAPDS